MRTRIWIALILVSSLCAAGGTYVYCHDGVHVSVSFGAWAVKPRLVEKDEQRRTAVHEVGHAAVWAVILGPDEVEKIIVASTLNDDGYYGLTWPKEHNRSRTADDIMDEAAFFLGGRAADKIVNGAPTEGASYDISHVNDIFWNKYLVDGLGDSLLVRTKTEASYEVQVAVEKDIKDANDLAEAIVAANKETVKAIADKIMRIPPDGDGKRIMTGDQFREMLREHPLVKPKN